MNGPIGPPPINQQPAGLLSFLGIKNGGRNPSVLLDSVQPGWDLRDHYLFTNSEVFNSTATFASGNDAFIPLAAATNAWRYVLTATVQWTPLNAADFFTGQAMLWDQTINRFEQPVGVWPTLNSTNGQVLTGEIAFPTSAGLIDSFWSLSNFWLPPGHAFGLFQRSAVNTAGGVSIPYRLRFVNLPA